MLLNWWKYFLKKKRENPFELYPMNFDIKILEKKEMIVFKNYI